MVPGNRRKVMVQPLTLDVATCSSNEHLVTECVKYIGYNRDDDAVRNARFLVKWPLILSDFQPTASPGHSGGSSSL